MTMEDDELRVLRELINAGRLVATIDISGEPFHFVTSITEHTGQPGKLILWLDPQGVSDDLKTVMADLDPDDGP
jgi:hypothetical protein